MLISSCCYSDPFFTLQCSGPYPESWSWRDCLNKSKLTPGFQLLSNKGLSQKEKEGRREDNEIGTGYNFQPEVIASRKVACCAQDLSPSGSFFTLHLQI